ncbi:MAG: RluA family pseudouridine synthase [Candidatus Eisenbacteria sp.]|nr:RluA family pseudouridine synthase [Candidatus Eisenbacteria bacterium]
MKTPDPNQAHRDTIRGWVRHGRTQVAPVHVGIRLDRYLAHRFTYRSRTQWRRMIREGRITVNETAVRPARPLRSGDRIGYVPRKRPEPPIDRNYQVLYCDPVLVAVAKSGNLPIHPSGRYFHHTLLHMLLAEHPEWPQLRIVHRIDRETSGLLLFGRSRAATAELARQFRERQINKRYLALVDGSPRAERFLIDLPLGPARGSLIRKAVGVREDGLAARTEVRVLHRGTGWAWVEARPQTGRLHQIRVHLKAAGLPIVGDKVYGHSERFFLKFIADEPLTPAEEAVLGLPRQALHAYQLRFRHPTDGTALTLTAPLPVDLCAALTARGLDPERALPKDELPA